MDESPIALAVRGWELLDASLASCWELISLLPHPIRSDQKLANSVGFNPPVASVSNSMALDKMMGHCSANVGGGGGLAYEIDADDRSRRRSGRVVTGIVVVIVIVWGLICCTILLCSYVVDGVDYDISYHR